MKHAHTHRTLTLTAIALLLAAMTTGNMTWCDALVYRDGGAATTLDAELQAGDREAMITAGLEEGFGYRFALCKPTVPPGVYAISRRELDWEGFVFIDLVTSVTTPPGDYVINYTESVRVLEFEPWELKTGVINLTVLPNPDVLTACFEYHVEVIQVNVPVTFWAYCSEGDIVQYRWWFNYNGNPNTPPDAVTTEYEVDHTYTTTGQRTVRLVVSDESGDTDDYTRVITVIGS